jgi:hypothetical protein
MLGAGPDVPATDELLARLVAYKELSHDYLHARGTQICAYTEWNGERIKPEDLPQEEKERLQKIIQDWKREVKL